MRSQRLVSVIALALVAVTVSACLQAEVPPLAPDMPAADSPLGTPAAAPLTGDLPAAETEANQPDEAAIWDPDAAAACLPASAATQRLYDAGARYCLTYPDEYKVERPGGSETILVIGGLLDAENPRVHINVSDAAGETAESAADRVAADFQDFALERSSAIVAGEPAVVLDKVPGQDINRRVIFVHDDLLYHLYFAPADEALGEVYDRMEALQEQVLGTFAFLPPDAAPVSDCLTPADGTQRFEDAVRGFCLLYPAGFTAETPAESTMLVYAGSLQDVTAPRLLIEIDDASGRTATELADAAEAEIESASPGLEIDRYFGVTLGDLAVERLDGLPGQELTRQLIAVQGDRVYRLTFMPADPELGESYRQMEALYDLVVKSFRFLGAGSASETSQPVTPIPLMTLAEADLAPSAAAKSVAGTYIVRSGDTLAKIAAAFGTTVQALLAANPQIRNPDQIYVGQRIIIPAPESRPSPPPAGATKVNIYLISIGDGAVGCGDGVVAVSRQVPATRAPLTAALNQLLSQRSQYYGESGLYNALYQSNLNIASITQNGAAWTIRLRGTLVLGGVCDGPRVQAQLEQTALQFGTVRSVRYFVNEQPLETLISGR